jgi:hypothetical protein
MTDEDLVGKLIDPPYGWRWGFPKPYQPREEQSCAEFLIENGYPANDAEWACKHCRFLGRYTE